ncbi:MAG: phosphomannomutase/phosphoglucomutase, partial [Alphaproteobacteria bacterium]|nr:phosphomannomutase/phosphoglucomutase [Alphaproteobacteria bacterium]
RTGHSWIKQSMAQNGAAFAGEMSGHMFFKHTYYGFDDGCDDDSRHCTWLSCDANPP